MMPSNARDERKRSRERNKVPGNATIRKTNVYFFPDRSICDKLVKILDNCQDSICICVFVITNSKLIKGFMDAIDRGVSVRIITEHNNIPNFVKSLHKFIEKKQIADKVEESIRLKLATEFISRFMMAHVKSDNTSFYMHHKFAICDNVSLIGSFNWTGRAAQGNFEDIIISGTVKLKNKLVNQFEVLWTKFLCVIL